MYGCIVSSEQPDVNVLPRVGDEDSGLDTISCRWHWVWLESENGLIAW